MSAIHVSGRPLVSGLQEQWQTSDTRLQLMAGRSASAYYISLILVAGLLVMTCIDRTPWQKLGR